MPTMLGEKLTSSRGVPWAVMWRELAQGRFWRLRAPSDRYQFLSPGHSQVCELRSVPQRVTTGVIWHDVAVTIAVGVGRGPLSTSAAFGSESGISCDGRPVAGWGVW